MRLSPTKEQKRIFRFWTDTARWVYNWTFDYIRSCVGFVPTWYDIKKEATRILPAWTKPVPFQIKGVAIKDALKAFWDAKGRPKFKSRKNPVQSCFIPSSAIKAAGIYPRVSGPGLKYNEVLPEKPKDSRLVWRHNLWHLSIPRLTAISRSENQASDIAAIDPGVRTFAAFYSPSVSGRIGRSAFNRIFRLLLHLDNLISDRAKANRRRSKSLTKAIRRLQKRIKCLIDELHWKTARFLCSRFAVILLPAYETKQMVNRLKRKIRSKTVRSMLSFKNFQFKLRLKWMAQKLGVTVIDVDESYTSKTHPQTGEVKNIGSAKWVKLLDGSMVDRDLVGAHNILVKWLTGRCALGDTPAQQCA